MPALPPLRLGVNIDHVATVRNARGGKLPDPLRAARIAEAAGADGITAHLREDRRHIVDGDIEGLMRELKVPLNFEMAATEEMVGIALRHRPHAACIVPEKREERTTAGGRAAYRPLLRAEGRSAARRARAPAKGGRSVRRARPRMPRRPWPELRRCRPGGGDPRGARTQHRPFPGGRGALRRAGAGDPRDAPDHGRRAGRSRSVILGIGNDLIDIRRIEKSLERFGDRFVQRIFTETEQKRSEGRATRAASYAKRFAAKEACAKALGTGLRRGVFWRDMGVINQRGGKPTMALTGGALARLQEITPAGMSPQIDLTLTDEY